MFDTQTFKIFLCTGIDLSTALRMCIVYKSPGRSTGTWEATLDPLDHTRMYSIVANLDPGIWEIYARAYFSTGMIPGNKALFKIERE